MRMSRRMCSFVGGVSSQALSNLSAGDILLLNETIGGNTAAVPFLLLAKDHHTTGYFTMCRLHVMGSTAQWASSNSTFAYSGCTLDTTMVAYKSYLDSAVQSALSNCSIKAYNASLNVVNISRYVFALSAKELGSTASDGTAISYFSSNDSRKATKAGETTVRRWWTRTPGDWNGDGSLNVPAHVRTLGDVMSDQSYSATSTYVYYRPTFALDSDTLVSTTTDEDGYYSLI